jgi:hypothetical protein
VLLELADGLLLADGRNRHGIPWSPTRPPG